MRQVRSARVICEMGGVANKCLYESRTGEMVVPTEYLSCARLWRALSIGSYQAVPAALKGEYTQPHLQMGKLRQRGHVTYPKLVDGRAGISPSLTQSHCALTPACGPRGESKGRR